MDSSHKDLLDKASKISAAQERLEYCLREKQLITAKMGKLQEELAEYVVNCADVLNTIMQANVPNA